ncbi:MAG TPA: C25 family cysteine peptidase, partial [Saprospiraceae bacterium]|nr:C25 family cysteine peptidase [Saprospiraceae bacterium]
MVTRYLALAFFQILMISGISGQMIDENVTRYGNEWIDYNKVYYKIPVSEDGIYKISYQELSEAGIPASELRGTDFRLYLRGEEITLFTSTDQLYSQEDYILFFGKRNKGELDGYMYDERESQLNPEYSLFTDTSMYFLTIYPGTINKRFRYIENDLGGNLPFKEDYYWHKQEKVNFSDHFKPTHDGTNNVTYSYLDMPEGYSSPMQQSNEFSLPVSNFHNSFENAKLQFRLATSISAHKTDILINGNLSETVIANGYSVTDHIIEIEPGKIQPTMTIRFEGNDNTTAIIDRNSIPIISLSYPREFVFTDADYISFNLETSLFKRFFEIPQLNLNQSNAFLLDLANEYFLIPEYDVVTELTRFLLPPSQKENQVVIFNSTTGIKSAQIIESRTFTDISDINVNYLIITHPALLDDGAGNNFVEDYANYRSSLAGGNYTTHTVYIQDIYDQFGYGIARHSQSLNNFSNYVRERWSNLKYLFIIGKGRDYVETRTKTQLEDPKNQFYIPTFGYHGADGLIAAKSGTNAPAVSIGRIAVRTPDQIREYLTKVQTHEDNLNYAQTIDEKAWMKKVIHLAGGSGNESDVLKSYLDQMADVIENNCFGANVVTYGRTSGTATEAVTDKIINDIEDGASIITFFGHSGVSTSDFNIGDLNNDKFPVFLSLGCYSGDIHTSVTTGQSEKFVLSPHGVIAFLASSGTAYITPQFILGKDFYSRLGNEMYGATIGEIFKDILAQNNTNTSRPIQTLTQQFTIHGDPAVRIQPHAGPDFTFDYSTIRIEPAVINSNEDHFVFSVDMINLGRCSTQDSLDIKILRKYPGGIIDTLIHRVPSPKYRHKVELTLPTGKDAGVGLNSLHLTLDYNNVIEELPAPAAEENNILISDLGFEGYDFFIISTGAKPVYPPEFGIVSSEDVKLLASTFNYFSPRQEFVFQIDTTELFNSPFLKQHKAAYDGGILEWAPGVNLVENSVYYWRVSPDSSSTGLGYIWAGSSFVYLPGSSEGWNQSHLYQYLKDEFNTMEMDGWEFDFGKIGVGLDFKISKYNPTQPRMVFVNGQSFGSLSPSAHRPLINIIAWGPKNHFYNRTLVGFGSISHSNLGFTFKPQNGISQREGMINMLEAAPDSSIVCFYTYLDDSPNKSLKPEEWAQDSISLGKNVFSVLESFGAKDIRKMVTKGTVPYLFIFKKGGKALTELIGKDFDDLLEASQFTTVNYTSGNSTSTIIGPSTQWKNLDWNDEHKNPEDKSYLLIKKIDSSLLNEVLVDSLNSVYNIDLSEINPNEFPFLKLQYYASDDEFNRTPPKFNHWRVHYKGLPDVALLWDENTLFHKDTLGLGESFIFKGTAFNNSSVDMDSLLVKYTVRKANNTEVVYFKKYKPLPARDTVRISFEISSLDLTGINEFRVELNPEKNPGERFYFNNI